MGIKLKTVDGQEQVLDPACGGRKFYFDKNNLSFFLEILGMNLTCSVITEH